MIGECERELIQRSIDGELDAREQGELESLLAASPEAREFHADLASLDQALRSLPGETPPAGLRDDIVGAIELPAAAARRDSAALPAFMRYGLAASVGLMIAVAFYEGGPYLGGQDTGGMVGTMAPQPADPRHSLAVEAVNGLAALHREGEARVLDFTWDVDDNVDVVIDLADTGLRVDALARLDGQPDLMRVEGAIVSVRGRGKTRIQARLHGGKEIRRDAAVIRIDYLRDGTLVHRGELTAD